MSKCASCGGPIEPRDGPGRPAIYCSDGCRRQAEFRIRALVRRIDGYESQIRWVQAGDLGSFHHYDEDERKRMLALLRRWLAEDQATLCALLGTGGTTTTTKGKK